MNIELRESRYLWWGAGKSESMVELIVSLVDSAPSTAMKKLLFTSGAELVGLRPKLTRVLLS